MTHLWMRVPVSCIAASIIAEVTSIVGPSSGSEVHPYIAKALRACWIVQNSAILA
jgi:hypothetical protein